MLEDTTDRSYSNVLDLHVCKDMLIVPRCDEKKVLFYQLIWTGIMYIVTRVSYHYLMEEKFCIQTCRLFMTRKDNLITFLIPKFKHTCQSNDMCRCWRFSQNVNGG